MDIGSRMITNGADSGVLVLVISSRLVCMR